MMTPSKPTPTQEDLDDLRDLAWDVVDRAIARFNQTRAHAERTQALLNLEPSVNHWAELETRAAVDAEAYLINTILATSPTADPYRSCDLERFRQPVRGVRSGETTYLVVPDTDRETNPGRFGGPPIMKLVVIEGNPILDMGDIVEFGLRSARPVEAPRVPPAPVEPPTPIWLATVIRAAEDLGEHEALRRIFDAPRKPGA